MGLIFFAASLATRQAALCPKLLHMISTGFVAVPFHSKQWRGLQPIGSSIDVAASIDLKDHRCLIRMRLLLRTPLLSRQCRSER